MESFAGKTTSKVVFGVGNGDWVPTTRMVPVPQGPGRVFDSLDPRRTIPTAGRHPIRPRTDGFLRKSGSSSKGAAAAAVHPGSLELLQEKEFQSILYEPLDLIEVGSTFDHHLDGGPGTTEAAAEGVPLDIEFANSEWSPLKVCKIGMNMF